MSQVAVDSSMGCAGIAQPQLVLKLVVMIDKPFLGVTCGSVGDSAVFLRPALENRHATVDWLPS